MDMQLLYRKTRILSEQFVKSNGVICERRAVFAEKLRIAHQAFPLDAGLAMTLRKIFVGGVAAGRPSAPEKRSAP